MYLSLSPQETSLLNRLMRRGTCSVALPRSAISPFTCHFQIREATGSRRFALGSVRLSVLIGGSPIVEPMDDCATIQCSKDTHPMKKGAEKDSTRRAIRRCFAGSYEVSLCSCHALIVVRNMLRQGRGYQCLGYLLLTCH